MNEEITVKVHLRNGKTILARCDVNEYDNIYAGFASQKETILCFSNCSIVNMDISAIEWD